MATKSIRSFLMHVHSPLVRRAVDARRGGNDVADSVYALGAKHAFFSPALPSALSTLSRTGKAYLAAGVAPLRVLVTTGSAELFHLEILHLASNLVTASRAAAVDAGAGLAREPEPFEVELRCVKGEVHAFPLVPEWVSPAAGTTMRRVREWLLEGVGRD